MNATDFDDGRMGFCSLPFRIAATAFGGLLVVLGPASAQTWTQTSAPSNHWTSVASSADGSKLVAVADRNPGDGRVYTSSDSGVTWAATSAPSNNWWSVASSADGSKLVAAVSFGSVYTSKDSGVTWTAAEDVNTRYWCSVASSADGSTLASGFYDFIHNGGAFYASTNSGATWTNPAGAPHAMSLASSADGTKWIAAGRSQFGGAIHTSTNSAVSWTSTNAPLEDGNGVASSADGIRLAAVAGSPAGNGGIYVSADSGTNWTLTSAPNANWHAVASSADGTRLVAAGGFVGGFGGFNGGPVYTSTDSGATWTSNNVPDAFAVTSSADGGRLVAVTYGGDIYTFQSTPTPLLNIAPSDTDLALSWTVPSMPFVPQENSDLTTTNWTNVPTAPALNLANLRHQVILSSSLGNRYFRLKSL